MEVSITPLKLQLDSGDASVSAMDVASGPEADFFDRAGEGFAVRSFANFGR